VLDSSEFLLEQMANNNLALVPVDPAGALQRMEWRDEDTAFALTQLAHTAQRRYYGVDARVNIPMLSMSIYMYLRNLLAANQLTWSWQNLRYVRIPPVDYLAK
jgi:hypothetical protein